MMIYPAIDLKDGACVRLLRGRMEEATIFSDAPPIQAMRFEKAGFHWLHLVDLNGAFAGRPVNASAVSQILAHVTMFTQLGGGIRDMPTIEGWLEAGITRVILGTVALDHPELVREACAAFPQQIVVGIDARGGYVATEGWAKQSTMQALDLARACEDAGVAAIIYTDIERDGAMQGANVEETARLAEQLSIPVILSGGISGLADLEALKAYGPRNIEGAVVGRALYDGSIDLSAAAALLAA